MLDGLFPGIGGNTTLEKLFPELKSVAVQKLSRYGFKEFAEPVQTPLLRHARIQLSSSLYVSPRALQLNALLVIMFQYSSGRSTVVADRSASVMM